MRYLNIRGEKIPKIGFGTWQIKGKKCKESVKDALEIGYRHIDTAQYYENEKEVGKGIEESPINRKEIFLTTKVWRTNLAYKDVLKTTKKSLKKLNTDYLDLLLIHWPNNKIDLEETLDAMAELKDEGFIKNLGVSNFTLNLLKDAQNKSKEPIFCDQVEYHPFISHNDLLEFCQKNDIMLTAYSPLARGKVLGNEVLEEIGKKYGKTETQVSLRYLIQQKNVVAIPKASNPQHRKENIDIFDFELSSGEMEKIANLSEGKKLVNPYFSPW